MSRSPPRRYSRSPSPRRRSRSRSRSPGQRKEDDPTNPGTNLYVTGLSTRVGERELENHFAKEGKVIECRIVIDPRTKESRGFGFVMYEKENDADRALKYLNRSTLEGRIIMVEKAKRKRARTPTPGAYLGVRGAREIAALDNPRMRERDRDHRDYRGGGGGGGGRFGSSGGHRRASPDYGPYRGGRDRSPRYSRRSFSPRSRSPSPYGYRR